MCWTFQSPRFFLQFNSTKLLKMMNILCFKRRDRQLKNRMGQYSSYIVDDRWEPVVKIWRPYGHFVAFLYSCLQEDIFAFIICESYFTNLGALSCKQQMTIYCRFIRSICKTNARLIPRKPHINYHKLDRYLHRCQMMSTKFVGTGII